jgi:hypothetical protein
MPRRGWGHGAATFGGAREAEYVRIFLKDRASPLYSEAGQHVNNSRSAMARLFHIGALWPKSILNCSGANQFTLNPYRGCAIGCAYCYVPHMSHMKAEPRKGGTYVDVKLGAALSLERRLSRLKGPADFFMSTATTLISQPSNNTRSRAPYWKFFPDTFSTH